MRFLETILAREGELPWLAWHQRRLERTLAEHGIARRFDLAGLLTPPREGLWRCRVVYGEAGACMGYLPYAPRPVRRLRVVHDESIEYRCKRTDRRALERLFAQRGAADDVVIVRQGMVTDTTIANIALFDGTRWLTPERPLLEGTTRARLIAEGFLHPAPLTLEALLAAERVAVMNALSGFVEVSGGILPEDYYEGEKPVR